MTREPAERIESAAALIQSATRAERARRRRRQRVDLPIAVLDQMLEELEQMNLQDVKRVPASFVGRIEQLVGVLPAEGGELPPLRTNISPMKLMDMVYDVQDRLLDARSGHVRADLDSDVA